MRWVLIKPLNHSPFYDPEIQEPLGLEYLASSLREKGCTVLLLDSVLDNLDDIKLARRAASFQPDAVGFCVTTDRDIESVNAIFYECKAILNGQPVFWIAGGNFVTTELKYASLNFPDEMHLMRFEADISIRDIVDKWNEKTLDTLPRLIDAVPPVYPDKLPFPARPYHDIISQFGWAFNIQGSRGCCSSCKYCASRGMRGAYHAWRGRNTENIVQELVWLSRQYAARTFNFVDEDFLGPPSGSGKRAKDFAAGIKENKLSINFGIQVRPDSLSEEVINNLYDAGLRYVFMGIESDNPSDFKSWGRHYCVDVWRWTDYLQSLDIEVNAGTLLFHPDSTVDGIRSFATKLREHKLLNYRTVVNRLDGMPGSFFYDEYVAKNGVLESFGSIVLPFKLPELESFYQDIVYAFAPLEAPSMHALCAMPTAQTNKFFNHNEASFNLLKSINEECDNRVASCFFDILNMFENKLLKQNAIEKIVADNFKFGMEIADKLIANGFVNSPESLYNAMEYFKYRE